MTQPTDTERLDWISRDHNTTIGPAYVNGNFGVLVKSERGEGFSASGSTREAIDAAMSRNPS